MRGKGRYSSTGINHMSESSDISKSDGVFVFRGISRSSGLISAVNGTVKSLEQIVIKSNCTRRFSELT